MPQTGDDRARRVVLNTAMEYAEDKRLELATATTPPALQAAIVKAYRRQIAIGTDRDTALNLATSVYQQRHPRVPMREARALVDALTRHASG